MFEVAGPDAIHIIDLGSAGGTVVNGKKVDKCALRDGDELRLGATRIVITLGAAVAEPAQAAGGAATNEQQIEHFLFGEHPSGARGAGGEELDIEVLRERWRTPRLRGVRILGECEHCGMPLPIPGPMRHLTCSHCQRPNHLAGDFWKGLLQRADDYQADHKLEYRDCQVDVRIGPPPAEVKDDVSWPPDWLRAAVQEVYCMCGAAQEGATDEPAPQVEQAAGPVVMSCPKCAAALEVTAQSERTVTCEYCKAAVYLPDPLWQRLHPVRTAEWWYVELRGLAGREEQWVLRTIAEREKWRDVQRRQQQHAVTEAAAMQAARKGAPTWIAWVGLLVALAVGVAAYLLGSR